MRDTDERVTRLLGALAARADDHVAPERVSRVRARARRTAAVRAGTAVATLVVAVAVAGSMPFVRGERADPADQVPVVVTSPGVTIDLKQDMRLTRSIPRRQPGAVAVFTVHVHGMVPARQVEQVSPSGREHLGGPEIVYDSRYEGSAVEGVAPCAPGGPLVRVDEEFLHTAQFERAGTYPVTVEYLACPPVGVVQQTITVRAE